jgi:hypothetical protein
VSNCTNCANLQGQVNRLQAENLKLRIKVRKLESEIDRLLRLIYSVTQYCYGVAQNAARVMQDHQARGTWAYLRGRYEVASVVCNALRGE